MNWLGLALEESPYIAGAIAYAFTFAFLSVARHRPVPALSNNLMLPTFFWVYAATKVMHFWPPTLAQSKMLVGTILACFLLGWIQSRLGSITFDSAKREFFFERSVLSNALNALFAGVVVVVALVPLVPDDYFGECALFVAIGAWLTASALGQWRRVVRAGGA